MADQAVRSAVNRILNREIREAVRAGMKVLYCIGESSEEQPIWKEVLKEQIEVGLADVEKDLLRLPMSRSGRLDRERFRRIKTIWTMIGTYVKEMTEGMRRCVRRRLKGG